MDNALHACEAVPEASRFVQVKARMVAGFLTIEVQDSCAPATSATPSTSASPTTPNMSTTLSTPRPSASATQHKRGRGLSEHGWGLQIVETVAQRYHGQLVTSREEAKYIAAVSVQVNG